ncbi:MAG: Hsp20/alpha crystallin family protein [Armatimonadetes bacterium]|nr:Hsp20/alpha crystallin family protein [Armatimonadota bacterium]MBS1725116.1 Hsp20/alpha crystallin family protein [Armatimonadota bacterium]
MNTLIPFRSLDDIRHFDDLFSRLMSGAPQVNTQSNLLSIPLDVIEDEGKVTIKAAVTGINPEELEITIENNVLTIKGEHKTEEVSENAKVFRRENTYGSFSRSIRLSPQLNQDAVSANFKNGFVTITIPKVEEEKPKALRIPVQTEN